MAVPVVRATEASLREVRQALQQINLALNTAPLNNWTATVDWTINDDATAGYSQGSWWYNMNNGTLFLCLDATPGAAVWTDAFNTAMLGAAAASSVTPGEFHYTLLAAGAEVAF
jgi:hypothetical protein